MALHILVIDQSWQWKHLNMEWMMHKLSPSKWCCEQYVEKRHKEHPIYSTVN